MKSDSGISKSYWMNEAMPEFSPLKKNLDTHVVVVGGGISGLTTAYLLAKHGVKTVLLEDGELAGGESSRTSAHIDRVIDDRWSMIERWHGEEGAQLAFDAHNAAFELIKKIVKDENIKCDLKKVPGYLFFLEGEDKMAEHEMEVCAKLGLPTSIYTERSIPELTNGVCLRCEGQYEFHMVKYLAGLANALIKEGVEIYTNTHVKEYDYDEKTERIKVKTSNGKTVKCRAMVAATNSPITDFKKIHLKQNSNRTYMIGANVPSGTIPQALYWDNQHPYHYLRVVKEKGHDLLLIGGEDHHTGQKNDADERYAKLEAWAQQRIPRMGEVIYKWSGQIIETIDGLGYIGQEPENKHPMYVITGDSGMGITNGTYGAIIVSDMIVGKKNLWEEVFSPSRIKFKAFMEMVKKDVNILAQYADVLGYHEAKNVDEIKPGTGALISRGLKKYAVYKSKGGELHIFSGRCPHLGGVLHWNSGEHSWDCPCHGSRFTAAGKVVNGPALNNMKSEKPGVLLKEKHHVHQ